VFSPTVNITTLEKLFANPSAVTFCLSGVLT
jgi:hypothetical protein